MGEPNTANQHTPQMHLLMIYCDNVGTLMAGTGMQKITSTGFWGCTENVDRK